MCSPSKIERGQMPMRWQICHCLAQKLLYCILKSQQISHTGRKCNNAFIKHDIVFIYPTQTLIRNEWYGCVFCFLKAKSSFWESDTFWASYIFWPRNNFNESGEKYIKDQIDKIYSTHIFIISLVELLFTTISMQISCISEL